MSNTTQKGQGQCALDKQTITLPKNKMKNETPNDGRKQCVAGEVTYRVEIVIGVAPDGNPDSATYENKTFKKYDDACAYALANLHRDQFGEVHLFHVDAEGDVVDHKTEIFSDGSKELGDIL